MSDLPGSTIVVSMAVKFIIKSLTKTIFEFKTNMICHIYLESGREWYGKERVKVFIRLTWL